MKIGINARHLQYAHYGVATYLSNLILNLKKIDNRNEYILFFGSDKVMPKIISDTGFDYDISRMPTNNQILKILWTHLYLPYAIGKNNLDLFHESFFVAPLFKKCPTIITIYDIAHLYIPEYYLYRVRLYLKMFLSGSIKQADSIITISENSKKDIIETFRIDPDRIKVVYGGVDEAFRPIDDKESLKRLTWTYGIREKYILAVSALSPKKNLTLLIRAFKLLRQRKKMAAQLVIVGEKAWWNEEIFREAASSGLEKDIVFCGYVPKEHLVGLYNAASVFAFPSLYEGFGLPVLEAMACSCPVVASNVSSLPEVCGNAALLINPKDIEALSDAIYRLLTEDSLKRDLIKKGLEQAKKFSWEKTAEDTLAVYAEAASKKG